MREYNAVRTSAAMFDVSPLFKYHVHGRDAAKLLDRVVTRDVSKCRENQVLYTTWCDDDGKIIDDGTLARIGTDAFRLTAALPTIDWLQDNAFGLEVEIEDVTHDFGALAIQGPTSRDLLQRLTRADLARLPYFHQLEDELAGAPVRISRTGYTGDLGYEIFVETKHALQVWDAIAEIGKDYGLQPAGLVALDVVRVEAGLLLIDVDFMSSDRTFFAVQKSTPYELCLGWTVKLAKDTFVGRDALRAEKARGPDWVTVGLVVDILALEKIYADYSMPLQLPYTSWNSAVPVYRTEEPGVPIGKATSGTWSPILKLYVVIARVRPQHAKLGSRVFLEETVEGRRYPVPAEVVKLPFFDPARKKETLS
jgi:aminomethyltransferase